MSPPSYFDYLTLIYYDDSTTAQHLGLRWPLLQGIDCEAYRTVNFLWYLLEVEALETLQHILR